MQITPARAAWGAALGMAAALAAGCGNSATSNQGTHALPAAEVVKLAAHQTSQVNSVTGDVAVRMSGQQPGSMQGTMTERIRPDLAANVNLTQATINGRSLPGGIREILSSQGIYIRMPMLSQETGGKPWVLIPESALNKATGNMFSQLTQQVQQENPLSSAQMLSAAHNVKQIGTGTVAGVPVTRYSGVVPVQEALSKLNPQARNLAQRQFSSMGITTIPFTAAVDQQHQLRQFSLQMNGTSEQMTMSFTLTGLNQPVSIKPPPSSQVTRLPASALSSAQG